MAINNAQQTVKETGNLNVPVALRNASSALMKELGYGEKYKYSHDFAGNFIAQEFLPEEIKGKYLFSGWFKLKGTSYRKESKQTVE